MIASTTYSVNDSVLTGAFLMAFWQKCIKAGVPEDKESLRIATQKADYTFNSNYKTNALILQKQFLQKVMITFKNGRISVTM